MKDPKQDVFYKLLKAVINVYKYGAIALIFGAFAVLFLNYSPAAVYAVDRGALSKDTSTLLEPVQSLEYSNVNKAKLNSGNIDKYEAARSLPPVNSNLPEETTLIIPSIGVNATVNYDRSGESGLEKGVWQPPNFGDPISGLPMLMMSHKYGLFGWSNDYRVQNSFGSLHLLNPGDKIIIIYEQREFEYIVTDKYEAAEPTEVNSDLMLYTCKTFRSDIRTTIEAKQVI